MRAQISAEFMMFVGLSLLISIIFGVISVRQLHDANVQNENDAVQDIASKLQKEIITASYVTDGYTRKFTIPDTLSGVNYSVAIKNSTVVVWSKNSFLELRIPLVTGNLTKGTNSINKTNGVVYVN